MSVGQFHDDFMSQGIGQEFGADIDEDELFQYFDRQCDLVGL